MTASQLFLWIHVVAATAWVGSMLFFAAVVVPVLREPAIRAGAPRALRRVGERFRIFGLVSLGVLVSTGIANLHHLGLSSADLQRRAFWATTFGRTLAWKLALVLLVVVATVAHDALVGRRALDLLEHTPDAPSARRVRRIASWLGRLVMLASLAIVFFAVALVRGGQP
jgi:copper resistance protein D